MSFLHHTGKISHSGYFRTRARRTSSLRALTQGSKELFTLHQTSKSSIFSRFLVGKRERCLKGGKDHSLGPLRDAIGKHVKTGGSKLALAGWSMMRLSVFEYLVIFEYVLKNRAVDDLSKGTSTHAINTL